MSQPLTPMVRAAVDALIKWETDVLFEQGYDMGCAQVDMPEVVAEAIKPWVCVEVVATEDADSRLATPSIPELVGYAEIAEMAGVSRQRAAQLAEEHANFPPAVVKTKTGPLRVRSQVEGWLARPRRTGRPRVQ